MPAVEFNRYYRYDELTKLLQAFADEHPDLIRLESIGKSHEGRDIWLLTVTDFSTGEPTTKPGFWCDGNIHASEVSASTAVLNILYKLVSQKPDVLQSRVFYLVPRLNPDGAEWALADVPKIIRSGTRPYPFDEEDPYGLEREDVDGDGRILTMRVKDATGPWKISEEEPRLMQRREPGETGGEYYRLLPEGVFHNFDGLTLRGRKIKEGLDFNRNFPSGWRPESEQHGAGPFPTSEPEIRAAVQAITDRANICGAITYHTFSGVILRVPGRCPDDDLEPEDVWTMKQLGAKGTEMSGYPTISVWHDFKYHPKDSITGVFDDWVFDHLGVYGWTVEIWSPQRQAGITDYKYIDWFRDHPFEHEVQMLKWSDEKLDGKGHIDWYPYDHPQLGEIEIGGWDAMYAFRNPPPNYLEKEIGPLADWAIWMAGTTPCLEPRDIEIEPMGNVTRIRFAVQNSGFLPTSVTEHAGKKKIVRGVVAEISVVGEDRDSKGEDEPVWLISGKLRQEAGQLKGWAHVPASGFGWHLDSTDQVCVFEWVVKSGNTYRLQAHHQRAGRISSEMSV
ncbi:M14 family metallopeptidase [Kamptonema cortianum]|nr:M14 family metallopeptidase [Geitlerinema splendidum]MDK3156880.1 M14 family metallopeptidase [Kamptonema cortianum]